MKVFSWPTKSAGHSIIYGSTVIFISNLSWWTLHLFELADYSNLLLSQPNPARKAHCGTIDAWRSCLPLHLLQPAFIQGIREGKCFLAKELRHVASGENPQIWLVLIRFPLLYSLNKNNKSAYGLTELSAINLTSCADYLFSRSRLLE